MKGWEFFLYTFSKDLQLVYILKKIFSGECGGEYGHLLPYSISASKKS